MVLLAKLCLRQREHLQSPDLTVLGGPPSVGPSGTEGAPLSYVSKEAPPRTDRKVCKAGAGIISHEMSLSLSVEFTAP